MSRIIKVTKLSDSMEDSGSTDSGSTWATVERAVHFPVDNLVAWTSAPIDIYDEHVCVIDTVIGSRLTLGLLGTVVEIHVKETVDEIDALVKAADSPAAPTLPTASLGQYLGELRAQRSASLRRVAADIGISDAYLSQIECGRRQNPSGRVLRQLARFYSVDVAVFIALIQENKTNG